MIKFKSCRWRRPPEDGPECCGHRDVLPIAGTSFNPEAWCPDCQFPLAPRLMSLVKQSDGRRPWPPLRARLSP